MTPLRFKGAPRPCLCPCDNGDCSGTSSSREIQSPNRVQHGLIALQNGYLFFMTQFPLGMPNLPLHCERGAHSVNRKKIHWFYTVKKKKKERRAHFAFNSMENQEHKVRDRKIGTWLFGALRNGAQQVERRSGKTNTKETTNPNREIFQQEGHGKWNGREESGNGTEPNQCQKLPNSSLFAGEGGSRLLAVSQKFLQDLLLSGWAFSSTGANHCP